MYKKKQGESRFSGFFPKEKKSQISLFIIAGIVIVIIVGFIFFYLSLRTTDVASEETTSKNQHIIGFIEGCVDQKAKQSLFFLGFIGGDTWVRSTTGEYSDPFRGLYYLYDDYYKIPYYYYEDIPIIESVKIKDILAEFINKNMRYCINNFENLNEGVDFVIPEDVETDVLIKDDVVIFNVEYPVIVKRGGQETELAPVFTANIPLRLKRMDEISREIV